MHFIMLEIKPENWQGTQVKTSDLSEARIAKKKRI